MVLSSEVQIVSVILLVLGIWLTLYLFRIILSGINIDFSKLFRKHLEKRSDTILKDLKVAIEMQDVKGFQVAFDKAVIIDTPSSINRIEQIHNHNTVVIETLLKSTETFSIATEDLVNIESLTSERTELFRLLFKTKDVFERVQKKRQDKDKPIPKWSDSEFLEKIKSIEDELRDNTVTLRAVRDSIIKGVGIVNNNGRPVYH